MMPYSIHFLFGDLQQYDLIGECIPRYRASFVELLIGSIIYFIR